MEKTYLVQRLLEPIVPRKNKLLDNPFSFGGGLVNGGFSEEAYSIVKQLWSFDYMGSSEFEWGAVPITMDKIAKYSSESRAKLGEIELKKPIFYLCESGTEKEVEQRISQIAQRKLKLKEPANLDVYLDGANFAQKYVGWLELNNGFMFFGDKKTFDNSLALFGIAKNL